MALFIKEFYDLNQRPETWADTLAQAVKHFYAANGVMANSLSVPDALYMPMLDALEAKGFQIQVFELKEEVIQRLAQLDEFKDMPLTWLVKLLSPELDYHLFYSEERALGPLQIMLMHMDGSRHSVN